jgi:hypothetical protein
LLKIKNKKIRKINEEDKREGEEGAPVRSVKTVTGMRPHI